MESQTWGQYKTPCILGIFWCQYPKTPPFDFVQIFFRERYKPQVPTIKRFFIFFASEGSRSLENRGPFFQKQGILVQDLKTKNFGIWMVQTAKFVGFCTTIKKKIGTYGLKCLCDPLLGHNRPKFGQLGEVSQAIFAVFETSLRRKYLC